ncbi:DUF1737 domain-containing protein [Nakamurella antarctica]|uniref:DUF1737 domain-containing protein n=1 Tax=Nakamurella antarctica TaxID=1902245 RepID=A0A3G8ZMU6_9ACTN|nr:DUF1737 domain-containing protein [Nakamurella antarctica]AZI58573.1 DUF1737 domain-containing protein [Nakamurella antarctica]
MTEAAVLKTEAKLLYRLITGPDDITFCQRISAALADGYRLYGSPAATFDPEKRVVTLAQAVVLDVAVDNKGTLRG